MTFGHFFLLFVLCTRLTLIASPAKEMVIDQPAPEVIPEPIVEPEPVQQLIAPKSVKKPAQRPPQSVTKPSQSQQPIQPQQMQTQQTQTKPIAKTSIFPQNNTSRPAMKTTSSVLGTKPTQPSHVSLSKASSARTPVEPLKQAAKPNLSTSTNALKETNKNVLNTRPQLAGKFSIFLILSYFQLLNRLFSFLLSAFKLIINRSD